MRFHFRGIHNLGAVWLELATQNSRSDSLPLSTPDELFLVQFIARFTHDQGDAQVQNLLDYALAAGWTPQRFFNNLQSAIHKKLIFDRNGTLIST